MDRLIPVDRDAHQMYVAGLNQGYANGLADAVRNLRAAAAHYAQREADPPAAEEALLTLAAQLEAPILPAELAGQQHLAAALWRPPVTPVHAVLESPHAEPPAAAPPGP